ncbi:tetratricopeptide repeat protein 37 [Papilio machaon]|uniref:tetratricopeptide repeat protein 37 n=1 Tax=Papilio machaon TaxID=76193 RepID=UPI001E6661EF|nr:tetratricopeptide repeat protein 37 [Papilio machaon]
MTDIKSLLKEARKLIDEKNFKEAQECCKNILRKDKQNYLGLVLLGKALNESDQAPLAYQKAIAAKPDHPLAWVGLANYYERKDDDVAKLKLIPIYGEILKLQIDEEKALECITKLGQLGITLKKGKTLFTLAEFMKNIQDGKLHEAAQEKLLVLLKADIICEEEDISIILDVFTHIYNKEPSESLQILWGKLILQKQNFNNSVIEVIQLSFFSENVVLREMLCKYLCEKFVVNNSFLDFPIESYYEKITTGIENSKYPGLLQSMIYYSKGLYLEAYRQSVPLINYQEAEVTEATFIIRCTIKLKKWPVTQKLVTNFLTKVKDLNFANDLKKMLFLSLAEQKKWKHAVNIIKEFPMESLSISEQSYFAKCLIEINEPVDHIIQKLKSTEHYLELQALYYLKEKKYTEVITLLENENCNMLHFLYMGIAYWEQKQYEKCLLNLLKAAKMDSEHPDTFLYLGYYYYYYKEDVSKSKKCFEKAYSINNTDTNIIKHLSEVYSKLQLKNEDFELLNNAKNCLKMTEWIDFKLGLHYLSRREWDNAINNFRNVIKMNHNNLNAFECLADAYYSRGSYTSALKAYNKVISLSPERSSHCLTRIGYIYSLLTEYENAISTFEAVLKVDPSSLLALKGISETWMRIAKKKFNAKLYGSARDTAQFAVNYLTKALTIEKKHSCFWNLLAESLVFITKLPNKYSFVYMKNTQSDFEEGVVKKEKSVIFPQILACYSRVAKQKQQITSYDLASVYLSYYHETKNLVHLQISFNLALACIKMKPSVWKNWNLLGKICMFLKKYDIAQHCFIKALLLTRKWSIAKVWCNLGTLYVKLQLCKLANYCFWRGQSTLPSYPQSWIGQGIIAETIREEEAMDLFRHASRLGYHPESALGYADWVCRTLKNEDCQRDTDLKYVIEGLHAVTYAIDLVEWFSSFEPDNACACTILGILQERNGLLRSALKSYEKGCDNAEDDKKNITLLNIGRIQVRIGNYDDAINTYKAITEASLDSTCGLALALYKKGLYEEAYSAYDTALHWLSNNDNEKADLLVAMAGIAYMYKGVDDAKTLLFHSIQISQKKPTPYSLFAICSLGIAHSDQSLSKLALSELQKYEHDPDFGYDIGFLKSYLVGDDNVELGIKLLSDSLQNHPSNANLWFCLAQYCLKASDKAKIASRCAQRAIISARYSEQDCNSPKMLATASIAEHVAGDRTKAMVIAKEGLHMYPCQSEVWAAVLLSILNNKIWLEKKDWILSAIVNMRRNLDISRPLSRWVTLLEKKLSKLLQL